MIRTARGVGGAVIKPHEKIAYEFAKALMNSRFELAHSMLGKAYSLTWSADWLKKQYDEMVSYGDSPAQEIALETSMTDWPDKQEKDIGWAYVSIIGDGFCEAVTVTSYNDNGDIKIRDIEWGRP